jgi:hypothetical protein
LLLDDAKYTKLERTDAAPFTTDEFFIQFIQGKE